MIYHAIVREFAKGHFTFPFLGCYIVIYRTFECRVCCKENLESGQASWLLWQDWPDRLHGLVRKWPVRSLWACLVHQPCYMWWFSWFIRVFQSSCRGDPCPCWLIWLLKGGWCYHFYVQAIWSFRTSVCGGCGRCHASCKILWDAWKEHSELPLIPM